MLKTRDRSQARLERRTKRRERTTPEAKLMEAVSAAATDAQEPKRGAAIKDHPFAQVEDLRDITMGVVFRSRMTYADIAGAGGASTATLSKWANKEVKKPHLDTMRRTLKACKHDMVVVDPENRIVASVDG